MQTILVTGGAGFIGSCLVRQLVEAAAVHVVILDRLSYAGHRASLAAVAESPRHTFVQGDVRDRPLVERLFAQYQVQAIVHLAAETHVDRSIDNPLPFVETNVVGTATLLEAARRYWRQLPGDRQAAFRFLHVSSDEVFGSAAPGERFDETSPYAPSSPYAASKAAADHLVRACHHTYGLPTLITHSSNTYGPFQFPEKLVPLATLRALRGCSLPVYGDGQQVRDWLYVDDHARALQAVLERGTPGESYSVGGECPLTNLQVVEAICDAVERIGKAPDGRPVGELVTLVEDRPGHDRRYATDISKIRQQLGWQPTCNFRTGVEQTVRWYAEHGDWVEQVSAGGDPTARLGRGDAART